MCSGCGNPSKRESSTFLGYWGRAKYICPYLPKTDPVPTTQLYEWKAMRFFLMRINMSPCRALLNPCVWRSGGLKPRMLRRSFLTHLSAVGPQVWELGGGLQLYLRGQLSSRVPPSPAPAGPQMAAPGGEIWASAQHTPLLRDSARDGSL